MSYQSPEASIEADQNQQSGENSQGLQQAITASTLGGVALLYTANKYIGMDLPEDPEFIFGSIKHPAVGYLGALAANILGRKRGSDHQVRDGLIGATIANFTAEAGQSGSSALFSPVEDDDFLSLDVPDMLGTFKDYGFALVGATVLGLQNKVSNISARLKSF